MGIKGAKCPFPIHYTNLDTHPRVNGDQSSDGQHRNVNNRPWAQYKTPVSSTSSAFKVHPEFHSAPSLYTASILKVPSVFEAGPPKGSEAGMVASSGLRLWLGLKCIAWAFSLRVGWGNLSVDSQLLTERGVD